MVERQLSASRAARTTTGADAPGPGRAPRRRRRPVLMIVHSHYDEDPRVRREAEVARRRRPAGPRPRAAAAGRGRPGRRAGRASASTGSTSSATRAPGLGVYLREYLEFFVRALAGRRPRSIDGERFALVQVHSLPDFLVFAALPLRLAGVPLILDLHEAMPEFFRSALPAGRRTRSSTACCCSRSACRSPSRRGRSSVNDGDARPAAPPRRPAGQGLGRHQQPIAHAVRRDGPSRRRPFRADGSLRLDLHGRPHAHL